MSGTKRTRKPVVRLAHGDSFIEFERLRTLGAIKTTKKTKRPLPRRSGVLTATGGSIGIPDLPAETNIEVDGLGFGFSRTYHVTAVTYTLDSDGYRTHFECPEEKD